ncbi:DUF3429 domain-containing protein [Burkholderia multivorans]|uniref:DUF3429 domain-containing protein n=4 Tax=Burkholderia cepacia complex TaxID=87882 RepID=A0A0H3KR18_BURM1|nr:MULTISPECIES: DUF3429 domain-containing protein [Burkholderia]KVA02089.1 hypothetical protein WI41_24535 [Burkholderia latens]MBR7964540.1 DUF3429 domain-containing protein [Burkholderia vietnamiensis]AOK69371.1 hypothetical protein WM33_27425 [Burkholderia multivorans]KVV22996.1 hypothetical protein WK80_20910 [Burkholderia multivorans]KVZ83930.1 hypothetical protein WL23_07180 [Burkholderia multivorans]
MSMRAMLRRYRVPAALALAGLVPFIALSWLSVHASSRHDVYVHALLNYAACIVSFVGAVHWGIALRAPESPPRQRMLYGWSVIPALMAWAVLMLPDIGARLAGMAIGLVGCAAVDGVLWRKALIPGWYFALRCLLTSVAGLSLLAAAASTNG